MPTKRTLIFIALAFVIGFCVTFFIIRSYNHGECKAVIKKEMDKNETKITKKE
jgi:uncharacterized membrane-anchored protein YhcB (DUF1043 family)